LSPNGPEKSRWQSAALLGVFVLPLICTLILTIRSGKLQVRVAGNLSGFDQTINLFLLAGLAIAIGEMADATIVIVENCTAQLARRRDLSAAGRMSTIVHATATMTRPLLFSMLIIVTSFLPVFFLGEREGRLFNPLAFSKTFAMAFSTLLTLLLLPVVIVWIFKRPVRVPAALTMPPGYSLEWTVSFSTQRTPDRSCGLSCRSRWPSCSSCCSSRSDRPQTAR
jgi:Cu/Ag efflux pump CusA